jgi:hypothetical protein
MQHLLPATSFALKADAILFCYPKLKKIPATSFVLKADALGLVLKTINENQFL